MVPAWRPTLDSGLLDVRWMRADVRFSRLRVAAALILGALGHSRVYGQCEVAELDVELAVPGMLATDGEVVEYQRAVHVPRGRRRGAGLPPRRAALAGPAAAVRRLRTTGPAERPASTEAIALAGPPR